MLYKCGYCLYPIWTRLIEKFLKSEKGVSRSLLVHGFFPGSKRQHEGRGAGSACHSDAVLELQLNFAIASPSSATLVELEQLVPPLYDSSEGAVGWSQSLNPASDSRQALAQGISDRTTTDGGARTD
jgi:hypothetical protein